MKAPRKKLLLSGGHTASSAGADGTLLPISAPFAIGDFVDTIVAPTTPSNIAPYYYPTVYDDGHGGPALRQNQALPVGAQDVDVTCLGQQA